MLNYNGGDFTTALKMQQSVQAAEAALGTTEDLYTGVWFVGMDRKWTYLNQNGFPLSSSQSFVSAKR